MSAPGPDDRARTDRLLGALVDDAGPVEPIYPMGRVAAGMLAIYVAWWLGSIWLLGGVRDAASFAEVVTDGFFVGLVSSIAGATGAALAAREPGRDRMARGALALGLVGVAAMVATFVVRAGGGANGFSLAMETHCLVHAALLGAVPAGVLLAVALGGWRGRPVVTSLAAATSGAALGCIAVHVTCPAQGAWHVMFGHYVFRLMTAALVGGVGALIWRYRARS